MRKVDLAVTEEDKYLTIKKLVETNGNKRAASLKLDCTVRHINRMIQGYKEQGKVFFQHGNKGRRPVHSLSDETKRLVVDLYRSKYYDANFEHYAELLAKREDMVVSPTTVRSIMEQKRILSPMATRSTRRKLKALLKTELEQTTSVRKKAQIQEAIVAIENAHPRRPRSANFGEMIQMDASEHCWFGSKITHLHAAIDDCTGAIVGAYFDEQETLSGYYNVLFQILITWGIPYMFYTDRRTVLEYKKQNTASVDKDSYTQFSYACKQLGIELETTSVPEAKGRVERLFQTLQSRLPIELRLAGVTTIEQANTFLDSYIKEFNSQFALNVDHTKSVFEKQPSLEKINLTLAVIAERTVDSGHSIRFNKKYFKTIKETGTPIYFGKGTSCLVIKAFDGQLFGCINAHVYALQEIPLHESVSRNFGPQNDTEDAKPIKRYIPPMNHPWRKPLFQKHVDSMHHRVS